MYADVVFPLNLPPLTYRIPANAPHDLIGRIISAPLLGRNRLGMIIDVISDPALSAHPASKKARQVSIKEIRDIYSHFGSEKTLMLIRWLSDYYLSPLGVSLKSMFFEEITEIHHKEVKASGGTVSIKKGSSFDCTLLQSDDRLINTVCASITDTAFRSFVLHADSLMHERCFLYETLTRSYNEIRGALILVSEIADLERLYSPLLEIFGERLCILHSRMSRTRRLTAVKKILENSFSVVLGTRSAVFAPLKNLSFIAVMNEQSSSYKAEEALRYNGRDVAVMRASIEQSCVLLSSVCPSLESLHNVRNGKYVLLAADQRPQSPSRSGVDMVSARPRIVVIDIRSRRSPEIILSREVVSTVRNLGSADTRLLFLVNKKGYSHIRCEECGHPVQCPQCRVPLIYYKGKNAVKCRFCGLEHSLTLTCEKCGSFSLKPSGTGTERLKEEVEKLLQQTVSILDKEHAKYIVKQVSADDPDSTRFVVGTSYATRKVAQSSLSAAVFLNIDAALNQPDFRAHERTFQDIMLVSQLMKPDGTIFIQTHNPAHPVIRFVKTYNFKGFFEYESAQRKALRFPPFSRIIHMTLLFKKGPHISLEAIRKNINAQDLNRVELWGPVEIPCHSKKWMSSIQIVLKSENRRLLHPAAKNILAEFKELKSVKIVVDVDPLKI